MADPDPTSTETGVGPDRGSPSGTPRWVKVSGIIALVVVLVFLVLLVVKGPHHPGMHSTSLGGLAGYSAPVSVSDVYTASGAGRVGSSLAAGGRR